MRATNGIDRDNPNYPEPGAGGATPNSTPTTGKRLLHGYLVVEDGEEDFLLLTVFRFMRMNNQLTAYQMNSRKDMVTSYR